jgi:hypothetical protein
MGKITPCITAFAFCFYCMPHGTDSLSNQHNKYAQSKHTPPRQVTYVTNLHASAGHIFPLFVVDASHALKAQTRKLAEH